MIPIIIVNWNGYEDTIECIDSTEGLTGTPYHIHLIDNGSDNREGAQLAALYEGSPHITLHQYDQNYGFTGAHLKIWDELLKDQESDYIVLLNNDTTVDPLWLSELVDTAIDKQCGIVSSKMVQYYERTKMDNAGHKMLNTGEILPYGHDEHIAQYQSPFRNMGGCGGAVLYNTEMLRKIGFFDEYFSTGYEDAELGLRAVVSGYECWYSPDAIIYHKGGQSIKKIFNEEYSTSIFTAILYSYFKNLSVIDLIINLPFLLFKYLCMLIIDIIFLRWKYLRIMLRSLWRASADLSTILSKRKRVQRASISISRHLDFFLWFDIKRFFKVFIFAERRSVIDTYGKRPPTS